MSYANNPAFVPLALSRTPLRTLMTWHHWKAWWRSHNVVEHQSGEWRVAVPRGVSPSEDWPKVMFKLDDNGSVFIGNVANYGKRGWGTPLVLYVLRHTGGRRQWRASFLKTGGVVFWLKLRERYGVVLSNNAGSLPDATLVAEVINFPDSSYLPGRDRKDGCGADAALLREWDRLLAAGLADGSMLTPEV